MDFVNVHLPLEILCSICQCLKVKDIQRARLACRALNIAASPFLIHSVWISSRPRDLETLSAISRHKVFSKSVREIIYDATVYESEFLEPGAYVTILGTYNTVTEQTYNIGWRGKLNRVHYSEAAVVRGYE